MHQPNSMKQDMTAEEHKKLGNKHFDAKKYEDAIMCYSRAIAKDSSVATFFTNRALCNLKMKKYQLACEDCRQALELDPNSVKGHFFSGQALLEMGYFDDAIKYLQRANDLAKDQHFNYGDEITGTLRMARKRRWAAQEEHRINKEIELQTYLNGLINDDKARQLAELKEIGDYSPEESARIKEKCEKYQAELNNLFDKVDERRRRREVPDYLCGKISFDIMRDPVITPSGITYERKDIEEHLQRVGHFDPVTRSHLTQELLTPNLALKEVVDAFIAENEWVVDY